MKKNLGSPDRVIRIVLALVLCFLYFNKTVTGSLGVIFLIVAIILALTSFISFCPLYAIFGFKTSKNPETKS